MVGQASELAPPVQRLGRYELVRLLGSGGMAEVYLGRHVGAAGIAKRVVIKRMRAEHAREPRFVELFLREARVGVELTHDNIVSTLDFGAAGNELFLVMEHVDGADLGTLLGRLHSSGTELDPILAAYVAGEIASALQYAHGRGLVHLDVTPRNILVARSGAVKLTDFGIAALHSERIGVRGTPAYMAPEQARGEVVSPGTDIFSLGLVLWESLVGRGPYDDAGDHLFDHVRCGIVPPLPSTRDGALAQIVTTALQPTAVERFASARTMRQQLERFLADVRSPGDQATPRERLGELVDRLFPMGSARDSASAPLLQRSLAITRLDAGVPDVPAQAGEQQRDAQTGAPPARRPRLARWLLPAALGASIALVAMFTTSRTSSQRGSEAVTATLTRDAGTIATEREPAPDAEPATPELPVARDAAVRDPGPLDVTPDGAVRPVVASKRSSTRRVTSSPPVLGESRGRVSVGSNPWAYVRIDGGDNQHETPFTIELPPGRHVLSFENPHGYKRRDIVIEVTDRDLEVVETLAPTP